MCERVVSKDTCLIIFCFCKYKTQNMCGKAVDDCRVVLKLVPDCFVTSKIIENIFTAFYANENILCFNECFGEIVFICSEMDILNIDLNNINLDDNFDVDNLDTVILITRMKLFYRKLFSTRREYRYHWKE